MKLFVDDQRPCPPGWTLARTITEAIRILDTQQVSEVSLDHDIAIACDKHEQTQYNASQETFEPVARYIALLNQLVVLDNDRRFESDWEDEIDLITLHTANYEGAKRMADILGIDIKSAWKMYDPENYK